MEKHSWRCGGCLAINAAKYEICVVCGYPASKSEQQLPEQSDASSQKLTPPSGPSPESSSILGKVLVASLPTAIFLQYVLLFLVPVILALLAAPSEGILCKASFEGSRAVPCSIGTLIMDWWQFVPIFNLMLLGLPTLASFVLAVIILTIVFSAQKKSAQQKL